MNYQEYYTQLGRLLYAIAKADDKVEHAETKEIRRIVKDELLALEDSTDPYQSDAAFSAEFEFEMQEEWDQPAEEAFALFRDYIHEEKNLPPSLKKVAFRSAMRVADSFRGINRQEDQLLQELKAVLREED